MLAIEKRGVGVVDSAPNPRVIKPAVQQRRQNVEIFTEADLTELPGQHKCAPRECGDTMIRPPEASTCASHPIQGKRMTAFSVGISMRRWSLFAFGCGFQAS